MCYVKKNGCRNLDNENRLIYSDSGHLSIYSSLFVIDRFKQEIINILTNLKERGNIQ